jgi:four helix bundle protein
LLSSLLASRLSSFVALCPLQENIQFCRQARGSLYELIDHVTAALECEYLTHEEAEKMIGQIKHAIILLNGYIKYLKSRKENG